MTEGVHSTRRLDRRGIGAGEHNAGRANHRFLIWSLMIFEWWNRLYIDGDPLPEIASSKTAVN